jgi:type IV pilus assembly protein PilV
MLLESLIAILLFSLGILALIGLQARSINFAGQAKYRASAALLADELVGMMWSDRANVPNYQWPSGAPTTPAALSGWYTKVSNTLPGVTSQRPVIDVVSTTYTAPSVYTVYEVTIEVFWRTPEEETANAAYHRIFTTAYIQN